MTEVAPSMSQKGTTLMFFLVVLPPVLGQLWCLSWWFCLLPWDNSDGCGIFWLGWLMDVGRYEGVAPSMWAFPAWFWRTSWSLRHLCPKRQLDVEEKNGGNQRSANFPLGFAPENGPHQVSSFLWQTQEKTTFRGTWWGPFSRAKQSGKLPERRRLQKIGHFQGHRWRNSHSFKSWDNSDVFLWGLRDIDGATHFQGIAMQS